MAQHWLTVGAYGAVALYLGYKMMVRIGDSVRKSAMTSMLYDKENTGCILTWIAELMMVGGIGTIIYAVVQYFKNAQ